MDNQYNYYQPEGNQQYHQNPEGPEYSYRKKKPKKKIPKAITVTGLAILFGVVSSAVFMGTNVVGSRLLGLNKTGEKEVNQSAPVASAVSKKASSVVTSDVSAIAENAMSSVVSITNMSVQEVQSFFGGVFQQESQSAGTGIIISQTEDELLMVTNYHVIENSETLTVTFEDESSVEANVKGTNAEHDLAVIAVEKSAISDETMEKISVATLGDSTKLKVGEPAIAIGNALGYGQSVTTGVISAVNRENTVADPATGETVSGGIKLIQTDAAINPGNSGGALLNINGEVIGINSSKLSGTAVEGMGYAIPISDVSDIIDELMNQKTKRKVSEEQKGYLGIEGLDMTSEISKQYHMPVGVYVDGVIEGGGAEAAGITRGNIITSLNGTEIDSMKTLKAELEYYAIGETVTVTIQIPENNGEYTAKDVEVTLGGASDK